MSNQFRYGFVVLLFTLLVILSACGGASNQANDAAPLPVDVPVGTPAAPEATEEALPPPEATSPPAESSTEPPPLETPATTEPSTSESEPQPETDSGPILTFNISGGIVGFCDELNINQDSEYTLRICDQDEIVGKLPQADRVSLRTWYENLADFHLTSEDNPGGPDNLITDLVFYGQGEVEADERQQQVIFDWANGLIVRLRPQQVEAPPTPEPVAVGPDGLCPDIERPALLTINYENPRVLVLVDPDSQATCDVGLNQPPFGRIATAAGNIYYPIFDADSKAVTVWQLDADGQHTPLGFTSVAMEEPGPFDFVISDDGTRIAWAQTVVNLESEPPLYRNNLWVADIDGTNQVALLAEAENSELRFVAPVRFSADGNTLYYALQPDIGGPVFSGRYDTLYSIPATGGQAQSLYACPMEENPVCIGGFSLDGTVLTVIQPNEQAIQVVGVDGSLINTLPLPATDYVERTAFGPTGNLAFVSAALSQAGEEEPPLPDPGHISFMAAPYTGQLQTLLSDNSVGTLWGWLDENRLAFGAIDQDGNADTSIITIDGQVTVLSPNVAVGVLR